MATCDPPTPSAISGDKPADPAVLDHVAVAVQRWASAWPRYVQSLGGVWHASGTNPGFAPCQIRFANDARLELLAPHQIADNPFLDRFLRQHGPGPHHLTFKVPDLDRAIDLAQSSGFEPIGIDRSDPNWFEAFIHPRQASGIVVQIAQQNGPWGDAVPDDFPIPAAAAASLLRATHVVANMEGALRLFVGLLGGRPRHHLPADTPTEVAMVDIDWDGPLALRLVGPADTDHPCDAVSSWLQGRPGRMHHLVLGLPGPMTLTGAVSLDEQSLLGVRAADHAVAVVPPEANFGTRLVCTTQDLVA